MWIVLPWSKMNVFASRECVGPEERRLIANVNANFGEVGSERSLHVMPDRVRQRIASAQRRRRRLDSRFTFLRLAPAYGHVECFLSPVSARQNFHDKSVTLAPLSGPRRPASSPCARAAT